MYRNCNSEEEYKVQIISKKLAGKEEKFTEKTLDEMIGDIEKLEIELRVRSHEDSFDGEDV